MRGSLRDWGSWQLGLANSISAKTFQVFEEYLATAGRPESIFYNDELLVAHQAFVAAVRNFLQETAQVVSPAPESGGTIGWYVINVKAGGWVDDYDERYEKEMSVVEEATRNVVEAWTRYAMLAQRLKIAHEKREPQV